VQGDGVAPEDLSEGPEGMSEGPEGMSEGMSEGSEGIGEEGGIVQGRVRQLAGGQGLRHCAEGQLALAGQLVQG